MSELGERPKVLLVDDESAVLSVNRRLIEHLGYDVESFDDPFDALTAFSRNPDRFFAAILDVMTPGMPGHELGRRLREMRPDVPVLLATGFSELLPDDVEAVVKPTAILYKPIPLDVLRDALAKLPPSRRRPG